jgi:hypothetical protein
MGTVKNLTAEKTQREDFMFPSLFGSALLYVSRGKEF